MNNRQHTAKMLAFVRMHLRKHALKELELPKPSKVWNDGDHKMLEMLTSVVTINEDAHGLEDV